MENNNNATDTLPHITDSVLTLFSDAEIGEAEKIRADLRAQQAEKAAAEATREQAEENPANTPPESRPASPGAK